MAKRGSRKILRDIEVLRRELYTAVDGRPDMLNTREVCEVSSRLDRLIVKHMCRSKIGGTKSSGNKSCRELLL